MLQINTEVSALTKQQRIVLADFILRFPAQGAPEEDEPADFPDFEQYPEDDENLTVTEVPSSPGPVLVTGTDKDGLPWDDRIHASSKAKNADGTWRKKRGVEDAAIAQVETELKALMQLPAPPVAEAPPLPPAPPAPPAPEADPAPSVPQIPTTVAPPADRQAFISLITKASSAIAAGKITNDTIAGVVSSFGVPSLALLANRLDLVPQVAATLDTLIAS